MIGKLNIQLGSLDKVKLTGDVMLYFLAQYLRILLTLSANDLNIM